MQFGDYSTRMFGFGGDGGEISPTSSALHRRYAPAAAVILCYCSG